MAANILPNISCDHTPSHSFCLHCALPFPDSEIRRHGNECRQNPIVRAKLVSAINPQVAIEVCYYCKYLIPSQAREEHDQTCVYKGHRDRRPVPDEEIIRLLSLAEVEMQIESGEETPFYFSQACRHCCGSELVSSCDGTLGCQHCRAEGEKCEYKLLFGTISLDCSIEAVPKVARHQLHFSKLKTACTACKNARKHCYSVGEPCKSCHEHNIICEQPMNGPWGEALVLSRYPADWAVIDNKLMEVRKQRRAIAIADQHFKAAGFNFD